MNEVQNSTQLSNNISHQEMAVQREPIPPLRPFIKLLWATNERRPKNLSRINRERLLPSGGMHLVFRLSDDPIRIFKSVEDKEGQTFRQGVIGGLRAGFYVKDISSSSGGTVGAILRPGASEYLFGSPADELAERHTLLEDTWGPAANQMWEQLQEQTNLRSQLDIFEGALLRRLPRVHGIHPAIAHALSRLPHTADIGEIVDETGYSHRRFIELFRQTVGLPPRLYTRILRFQQAFKIIAGKTCVSWVDVAMAAGYFDQAHFNREFREFAGMSPTQYLISRTGDSLHVPILPKNH